MKQIFFLFLFLLKINIQSQELVPNGSFEMMRKMPSKKTNYIYCTQYWQTCSATNADYYSTKAKGFLYGTAPMNGFGKQKPRTGEAYAGICIEEDFIEYIEVALTETMEKGKEYNVEFYVSRADFKKAYVKEFGVLFLDKIRMGYYKTGIPHKPQLDFYLEEGYRNKKDWVKISGTYVAEGFESAIIIGYFNYDQPEGYKKKAHYYIDDVSIKPYNRVYNTKGN
jgi:hypothetical protein